MTLAANGVSCTLQITFTPTALGLRTLTVSIADTRPQLTAVLHHLRNRRHQHPPSSPGPPLPQPSPTATPLGTQQLDAIATTATGAAIPGSFTYTPTLGSILPAGAQTLSALFTPLDPRL